MLLKSIDSQTKKVLLVLLLAASVFCAPLTARAAVPGGVVEEASGGVWAMREGKRADLAAGGDVFEFAILE
ncbi:MAG: hypothetical protein LBS93_03745, partial [Synergistaceae bacterium]|nr:hypothetical protein [Synergistaceae bacterium]